MQAVGALSSIETYGQVKDVHKSGHPQNQRFGHSSWTSQICRLILFGRKYNAVYALYFLKLLNLLPRVYYQVAVANRNRVKK